jgi:hypothetical protein
MKIAITGHTKGFGAAFAAKCHSQSIQCIGFSRSNGYDINLQHSRKQILEESASCDVFINNAYDRYGQIDLLYDLYNAWIDQPRHIITIGSYASNAAEWRLQPCLYSTVKKALDTVTYQLLNSHGRGQLKVSVIKPSYMGPTHSLSFDSVADRLLEVLHQPNEIVELVIKS